MPQIYILSPAPQIITHQKPVMKPLSKAELAQRAAQDIAMVASELLSKYLPKVLSRRELVNNLAKLAGSLMNVSLNQEKYEQGEHRDQQDRLEQLLGLLEMVCTVRSPIYPHIQNTVDHSIN